MIHNVPTESHYRPAPLSSQHFSVCLASCSFSVWLRLVFMSWWFVVHRLMQILQINKLIDRLSEKLQLSCGSSRKAGKCVWRHGNYFCLSLQEMILQDVTSRFIPPVVCRRADWTLQHSAEWSYSMGNFWFTNMNVMLNEVWFLFLCALWTWRFQKKRQKNISLLKTLNQNICRFSFHWSISRLVTAATVKLMCKRSGL